MSAKCFYNIHCTIDNEAHHVGDVKKEELIDYFNAWLDNQNAEDSWSVYSHEILFTDDGFPFNDDSGEVYDDI